MTPCRRTLAAIVLSLISSCAASGLEEEIRRDDRYTRLHGKAENVHKTRILDPNVYYLQYDERLLLALREFYLGSVTQSTAPSDADQHHVVVKTNNKYGNGYLIDDSGLVLTAFHVVEDAKEDGATLVEVIDRAGRHYFGARTEVGDRVHDWAVVMIVTNKPQRSHLLPFAEDYELLAGTTVQFTPYTIDFGRRGASVDRKEIQGVIRESYSNEGAGIIADRTQENRSDLMTKVQKRFREDIGLTARSELGMSGSVVFACRADTRKFCGVVWGHKCTDTNEQGGPALVVRSTTIRDGLREFLDAQGMLQPLEARYCSGF